MWDVFTNIFVIVFVYITRFADRETITRVNWRGETRKTESQSLAYSSVYSAMVIHKQSHSSRWAYNSLRHAEAKGPARLVLSYSPHHTLTFTFCYAAACGPRPLSWQSRLTLQAETCHIHSNLACNHEHGLSLRLTVIVIIIVIIRFSAKYFNWLSPQLTFRCRLIRFHLQ